MRDTFVKIEIDKIKVHPHIDIRLIVLYRFHFHGELFELKEGGGVIFSWFMV